jgi:glucosamine 6-phosphate synthetase-like amidotransferase/phosphosugar isomerase protein
VPPGGPAKSRRPDQHAPARILSTWVAADTLAALKHACSLGMSHTLTICNLATSAMVRECELAYITRAGVEIGVASTKAFTTQLAGLYLLTLALAQVRGRLSDAQEAAELKALRHLPVALQAVLALEPQVIAWSEDFARKEDALFLGRGLHYPIALEGALKLKEISYIHAEAYPAGELKHGPLALVTEQMPTCSGVAGPPRSTAATNTPKASSKSEFMIRSRSIIWPTGGSAAFRRSTAPACSNSEKRQRRPPRCRSGCAG